MPSPEILAEFWRDERLAAVEAEVQRLGRQLLPHEEPWYPAVTGREELPANLAERLCSAIEALPPSREATEASVLASELRQKLVAMHGLVAEVAP